MLDLAIRGGELVDGTGAPRRRADVGIQEGRVVAIGDVDWAREDIDATGLIVSPGFIDVHSHIDAQVFWDPALAPECLHGATSTFAGNCGVTLARWEDDSSDYLVRMCMTLFLAEDLTAGMATPMDDERIETGWFTRKEVAEMIAKGVIQDAKTMVGYLTWKGRR